MRGWICLLLNVFNLAFIQKHNFKASPYRSHLSSLKIQNYEFTNQNDYLNYLESIAALPKGFSVGLTRIMFTPFEVDKILPMNVTLILCSQPSTSFAAVFTSNQFPGGPVLVGRDRIRESQTLQAIIINNKISNVCPGGVDDGGYNDSDRLCEKVAQRLGLDSKKAVFPCSTGIIGWRLPVETISSKAIPELALTLQTDSILPAAKGICTTDRYPKIRSEKFKRWSIVGIAKGAGMIEPNMATMLSFILTDLAMPRSLLESCLREAVTATGSFNSISVDSDQSTSDTVLILSSQSVKMEDEGEETEFRSALIRICKQLAEDIVRNGEGTQHVIRVRVSGAPSERIGRQIGKSVVNSPLVKCAMSGCDPNVGRIVGAIGNYLGKIRNDLIDESDCAALVKGLTVTLGDQEIFKHGAFALDPKKEKLLSDYLYHCQLYPKDLPEKSRNYPPHERCVDLKIHFDCPNRDWNSESVVIGSDLTNEYVEENADYRS